MEGSYSKHVRLAAMHCTSPSLRVVLHDCATACEEAAAKFAALPSQENLREVVGVFACAERWLTLCPPLGDDSGGARMREAA